MRLLATLAVSSILLLGKTAVAAPTTPAYQVACKLKLYQGEFNVAETSEQVIDIPAAEVVDGKPRLPWEREQRAFELQGITARVLISPFFTALRIERPDGTIAAETLFPTGMVPSTGLTSAFPLGTTIVDESGREVSFSCKLRPQG